MPADVPRSGPNTKAGEKPPVLPVVGTMHTQAGAEAFATFFVRTLDWGFGTVNASYMRHYFNPSCIACSNYANSIDKTRKAHDRYVGGRITVLRAHATGAGAATVLPVDIALSATAGEALDKKGHFVHAEPAYPHATFHMKVQWRNQAWTVVDLGVQL